jgi:branched-subunit amino acid transport protein
VGEVWFAIVLAGAGTFAMRASFIAAATRLATVPPWADRILRQIPPAALAAIVLPALIRPEGTVDLLQPRLAAGVLAGLVAWKTRNVLLTLVLGIGGLMAIEAVWPW